MSGHTVHAKPQTLVVVENDNTVRWMQAVPGIAEPMPVANDTLYHALEMRYGGGFAQWVIDGLQK